MAIYNHDLILELLNLVGIIRTETDRMIISFVVSDNIIITR